MARRNSSDASGRRSSRTNSGGRSSAGRAKSSDKPFKKSNSSRSGRSSSFSKREGGSFRKRDDQTENRSGGSRPYSKRKNESSSERRSYGNRSENYSSDRRKSGDRSFKKAEKDFRKRDDNSSPERGKKRDSNFKKGPSFGLPYKRSYDKKKSPDERPFRSKSSSEGASKERFKKYSDRDSGKTFGTRDDTQKRNSAQNRFSKSSGKNFGRSERIDNASREKRDRSEEQHGFFKKSKADYSKRNKENKAVEDVAAPTQSEKIRLNKYIANSGVCSRREADELITMGLVSVNGKTITELGYKVNPGDEVRYENKVLKAEKHVYILLNKPKGYLTTTDDPQERNTVMHIIGSAVKERIYPVGRLDRNTTGLLLLTNDGDLADKLMHPSYNAKKIYKVELDRPLTKADLQTIIEGVQLEEGKAQVDDIAIISEDGKTIGVEIHIGWNRVVRRIFENFGYVVTKLDRSVYAGLDKKNLGRGEWRFLTKEEVVRLKHYQ